MRTRDGGGGGGGGMAHCVCHAYRKGVKYLVFCVRTTRTTPN